MGILHEALGHTGSFGIMVPEQAKRSALRCVRHWSSQGSIPRCLIEESSFD